MSDKKSFYITTTLPYVNADLHMGHALEFIRADIIVRYKKLIGLDVFFNTGTDEHGMKIYEKALIQNKNPKEFVDESFLKFKESVKIFGMDSDVHFIMDLFTKKIIRQNIVLVVKKQKAIRKL